MIQGGSGVGGVATTDVPTKSSKKLGVDIDFLPRNQVDVHCTAAGVMSYPRLSIATLGMIGVVALGTTPAKHLVSSAGSLTEAHCTEETAPRVDFLAYAGVVCFWLPTTG